MTGANIHWSSTPMTNCPLFSASRKRARASPDMLSGPERFLKQVGPQIAYLPIRLAYRPHWRCTACHAEVDPCFDAIRVLGKQILLCMFMSSGPSSNPSQVQLRRTGAEKASSEQHGSKAPLSTMTTCGISSNLQRVMKPTIALTGVHVAIEQTIFDGFLLIGCQVFDLVMVRSHLPSAHSQTKSSSRSVAALVRFLILRDTLSSGSTTMINR